MHPHNLNNLRDPIRAIGKGVLNSPLFIEMKIISFRPHELLQKHYFLSSLFDNSSLKKSLCTYRSKLNIDYILTSKYADQRLQQIFYKKTHFYFEYILFHI